MEVFEKIIEKLKSEVNYNDGAEIGLKQSIEVVNQVKAEYNDGWIPCSKRLPDHDKPVFVDGYWEGRIFFIAHYEKESQSWIYESDEGMLSYVNVYAWMPLPKRYIGKLLNESDVINAIQNLHLKSASEIARVVNAIKKVPAATGQGYEAKE